MFKIVQIQNFIPIILREIHFLSIHHNKHLISYKKVIRLCSVLDLETLQNLQGKKLGIFITTNSIGIDRKQILIDKIYCRDKKVVAIFFNTEVIRMSFNKVNIYKEKESRKIISKQILTLKMNNKNIHISEHLKCWTKDTIIKDMILIDSNRDMSISLLLRIKIE